MSLADDEHLFFQLWDELLLELIADKCQRGEHYGKLVPIMERALKKVKWLKTMARENSREHILVKVPKGMTYDDFNTLLAKALADHGCS
jgi:hypothetical protein